jgi:transcriptional regulator with XRE-family HTH domain
MNNPIHLILPHESKKNRSAIIAHNIFALLKKRGIKLSDFAKEISVDCSTLYKWKNGNNEIPTDMFDVAAKCLNVTANDLFYDEKEKVGMPGFEETSKEAKLLQKIIYVRHYRKTVSNPFQFLVLSAVLVALFSLVTFFLTESNPFWGLLGFGAGIALVIFCFSASSDQETLIVQQTDKVYYKAVTKDNPIFKTNLLLRAVSFLSYAGLTTSVFFTYRGSGQDGVFIISLIFGGSGLILSTLSFFEVPPKCPDALDDFSFGPFYLFVMDLALSISLTAFSIGEMSVVPFGVWPGVLCGSLSALSDGASLWLSGRLFSQYKMVIERREKGIEELYR